MKEKEFLLTVILYDSNFVEIHGSKREITIVAESEVTAVSFAVSIIPNLIAPVLFNYGYAELQGDGKTWSWSIDSKKNVTINADDWW